MIVAPGFLRVVNHGPGDAVLDRPGGVEVFQLDQKAGAQALLLLDVPELKQRRMPNQLVGSGKNTAHGITLLAPEGALFFIPTLSIGDVDIICRRLASVKSHSGGIFRFFHLFAGIDTGRPR